MALICIFRAGTLLNVFSHIHVQVTYLLTQCSAQEVEGQEYKIFTNTCWSKCFLNLVKMMSTVKNDQPNSYTPHPGSVHSGYSGQVPSSPHQTVVTMTTDPNQSMIRTEINLNIGYFKTLPGGTKIVQLVFGIVCMACSSPAREYVGQDQGDGEMVLSVNLIRISQRKFLYTCLFSFRRSLL